MIMKIPYRSVLGGCLILCVVLFLLKTYKKQTSKTEAEASIIRSELSSAAVVSVPLKKQIVNDHSIAPQRPVSTTDQILALLASGGPLDQSKVYTDLLPAFIRHDPIAAASFAQSPEAAQWHDDLMVTVAQVWTGMDVDDAEKWATQLSNPTERNMVLGYVCFAEANIDQTRAVQVLGNSEINSARREIIVENLAQQWANQDLEPLYNQIAKLTAGDERDGLLKRIALAQSQTDPQLAAQIIAEKIAAGPIQTDAALYVLRQWAKQDMAGAVAWANQFPRGDLRDKAMTVLSGNLYGAYTP